MRPLLIENEKVNAAVKDGAFRKHLQTEHKHIVIDSLNEFFGLNNLKHLCASKRRLRLRPKLGVRNRRRFETGGDLVRETGMCS